VRTVDSIGAPRPSAINRCRRKPRLHARKFARPPLAGLQAKLGASIMAG